MKTAHILSRFGFGELHLGILPGLCFYAGICFLFSWNGCAAFRTFDGRFISQIEDSDHIVLANRFANGSLPSPAIISGKNMHEIIYAIARSKSYNNRMNESAVCAWQLEFYRGPKLEGQINFQGEIFRYGGREYYDNSGVLEELYARATRRDMPGPE